MKLKFGKKLVLSGLALAACAATLSTTTYAWYVSNSEASVSGINGSTLGAEASGNLLVSKVNESNQPTGYMQNITLDLALGKLVPVTKATDAANTEAGLTDAITPAAQTAGTFVDKYGAPVSQATTDNEPTAYYEYKFYVMSTEAEYVKLDITYENSTKAADETTKQQITLNTNGAPTAKNKLNDTFLIDATEALRMEITMAATTAKVGGDSGAVAAAIDCTLDKGSWTPFATADKTGDVTFTASAGGDANVYYNALLGQIPYGVKSGDGVLTPAAPGAIANKYFTLAKNEGRMVTVKIWLEGTDAQCFDSCIGQTFAFKFKLTALTEAPTGTILTPAA